MLIASSVLSQSVTDSICFDFTTVKLIAIDLNELDQYRAMEPLQLSTISNLRLLSHNKDSIINNLNLQVNAWKDVNQINEKQFDLKPVKNGWIKWAFLGIGVVVGGLAL